MIADEPATGDCPSRICRSAIATSASSSARARIAQPELDRVLIEHNLEVQGRKTVLASHSMGALIVLYFFKWVESPGNGHGNGGPDWCERHIAGWANIAGTLLGVPKAMAACVERSCPS